MAEGVAHAPDASFNAADSRADCDTGGVQRRPVHRCELAEREGHRPTPLSGDRVDTAARATAGHGGCGGTLLPRLRSPLFFFAFGDSGTFPRTIF
jgi:hypothetical protein